MKMWLQVFQQSCLDLINCDGFIKGGISISCCYMSLKFPCLQATSKYLQVSTLRFSFRILWSCVFSYQNQPYSGSIVHVGIKQYKFCLFIHWFCTWWILAYASHPHVCWVGFLMILLIYSHFNLYFFLGSFLYIPNWTYTRNNNWPIKATWLLSEIVEGQSIWTFFVPFGLK